MIKIAFFDIDHTLYNHQKDRFEISAIHAIKKLHDSGVKIAICTARPYHSAYHLGALKRIAYDDLITANGAVVFAEGKIIKKDTIPIEVARNFVKLIKDLNLTMECVSLYDRFMISKADKYVEDLYSTYKELVVHVKDYEDEELTGFLLFAPKKYDAYIKKNTTLNYFRFADSGVDIMGNPHIKGEGVKILLSHYGFKKEEAIAFGDDLGDISMFEEVGISVAMGNGKDEVKKAANYITSNIGEAGIKKALKHFKLI